MSDVVVYRQTKPPSSPAEGVIWDGRGLCPDCGKPVCALIWTGSWWNDHPPFEGRCGENFRDCTGPDWKARALWAEAALTTYTPARFEDVGGGVLTSLSTEVLPDPIPNGHPAVWDLVVADMAARDRDGRRKYGVPLQPHNGRKNLQDAYQEALDLAVYLRAEIYERTGR